jgi:hypothetical protein
MPSAMTATESATSTFLARPMEKRSKPVRTFAQLSVRDASWASRSFQRKIGPAIECGNRVRNRT